MLTFGSWSGPDPTIMKELGTRFNMNDTALRAAFNATMGNLVQMHLHGIGEHVLDGATFRSELHIVRKQSNPNCTGVHAGMYASMQPLG